MDVPEGWEYEPADPSAGIWSHAWIHCDGEPAVERILDEELRENENVRFTIEPTCLTCGAKTTICEWHYMPDTLRA